VNPLLPIDYDGRLFVAANHWPRAWYDRALENPNVSVTRNGEATDGRALPVGEEGVRPQRRVRTRLHPPPSSLLLRRLPARTAARPEKSPRFRGVLAVGPGRIRTGDCGFGAPMTTDFTFVSAARLGGSD
jgi:hypothetical protein